MGDAESTSAETRRDVFMGLKIPKETLVLISGGPPRVDHSRIKQSGAKENRGLEGRKLAKFGMLVLELKQKLHWDCTFLIEHVVPWGLRTVNSMDQIMGVKVFVADVADLGLVRKPRVWWTDAELESVKWKKSNEIRCQGKAVIQGIEPLRPREVKVGVIDGIKYKFHKHMLQGLCLLPCPTRMADARGWAVPKSTDWADEEAIKRHK